MRRSGALEVASLQGRTRFAVASRAAIIDLEPDTFKDLCEALSRRHRILRSAGSEKLADGTVTACYEFVHVLYREVCYRRITLGRRAQLHRGLGDWVEAHFEPLNEAAAGLAVHFEQGGDWARAIKYPQLAADTSARRFEPRQAAEILQHALELVRKLPEAGRATSEIEILAKLATIYTALVDDIHAIETYEALATRAARDGLIDLEVRALIDIAYPLAWTSSQRSLEAVERAVRLSARQENPLLRTRARANCFALRLWQEWDRQDAEKFQNAFAEIRNGDDRRILAPHLADYGFVSWISSEYREARRGLIESRVIMSKTLNENPYLNAAYVRGRFSLTWNLLFLGEWGEALQEIEDAIAMFDKNANYYLGAGDAPPPGLGQSARHRLRQRIGDL